MAITIDKNKCTACGKCVDICLEDVLGIENGAAAVLYPRECWRCGSCVYDCAFGAITVDLDADNSIRFIEF
ncbi:MAG: 4Fe-4S binding protein [Clostridiales Family XIII bacterium]|jgi:adenylylsulfate reductase subunit B|nr:4Fe-4S binding protein [Clostridiales Family XIII bacterium]